MVMKEIKNLVEVIGKEIEIFKIKLLLFMTIASGSWVYIFKMEETILKMILVLVFFVVSFAIFSNILKLIDLHMELKGLKND